MKNALILFFCAFAAVNVFSSEPGIPNISTFSIVAFDPETGELGVAVQSKFIAVGSVVPWAKAGVGAIATQAWGNTTYGPEGLELLAKGKSPEEVLTILTEKDVKKEGEDRGGKESRQIGIVDAKGNSVTFTGSECFNWAGGIKGKNFSVQGNILTGPEVVEAMAEAFNTTKGELAERLISAIEAGQHAGGDSRGRQPAALLIVKENGGYSGFNDRYIDLRVDDHAEPIQELKRIYNLYMETMHQKIKLGSRLLYFQYGTDVLQLETMLNELGYLEEEADDIFREPTEEALKEFRKNKGLSHEYGFADEQVIRLLQEDIEKKKD